MRDYRQNGQGNANRICEHGHMNNVVLSKIINEAYYQELNGSLGTIDEKLVSR